MASYSIEREAATPDLAPAGWPDGDAQYAADVAAWAAWCQWRGRGASGLLPDEAAAEAARADLLAEFDAAFSVKE